jgi:epsin
LVLLEYLVKNGSERVVDDARSHISMIKMMKNFHYVDEKGKDQGINGKQKALVYPLIIALNFIV